MSVFGGIKSSTENNRENLFQGRIDPGGAGLGDRDWIYINLGQGFGADAIKPLADMSFRDEPRACTLANRARFYHNQKYIISILKFSSSRVPRTMVALSCMAS